MYGAAGTFRVFVSSPFEDLTEERNALQRDVFAGLNELCRPRGARFQTVDLRWSVPGEAGLDHRTMEICFAEIERCRRSGLHPNFIILLGHRYGWCPLPASVEAGEFERVRDALPGEADRAFVDQWYRCDRNARPAEYRLLERRGAFVDETRWEREESRLHALLRQAARDAGLSDSARLVYEASATHQEIMRRLADRGEHVFAFCRAGSDGGKELADLRAFLRQRLGDGYVEFTDVASLCSRAREVLEPVVTGQLATRSTSPEPDGELVSQYTRHFAGRAAILDAIAERLQRADGIPVLLHGPAGSGKSSIMARSSAIVAAATPHAVVIRRFIGASPESSSESALLRGLCLQIARAYDADDRDSVDDVAIRFGRRLGLATAQRPLVLFLDGIDELTLTWLPERLPPDCHIVLSAIEPPRTPTHLHRIEIGPLSSADAEEALSIRLDDARRTLQPAQRRLFLEAMARGGLPLHFTLAFEEARRWRSFDVDCALPDTVEGSIDGLLERLSRNHDPVLVRHALGYLSASRYGLSEDEIFDLLTRDGEIWSGLASRHEPPERRLPFIVWSRLFFELQPYLTERVVEGTDVIALHHRHLSDRLAEWTDVAHARLAQLFRRIADPNEEGSWSGTLRGLAELPFHLDAAKQIDALQELLFSIEYADARCNQRDVHGLLADFDRLPGESRELRDFIFSHAQALTRCEDILFALIEHEGSASLRERADALLRARRWRKPWLRTVPVPLPSPPDADAIPSLVAVGQYRFPRSAAVALAAEAELAFHFSMLGRIAVIDLRSMRAVGNVLQIPTGRVLALSSVADGTLLAVAFESGELHLLALELSSDRNVIRQTGSRLLHYRVPESEAPAVGWNGRELLLQRPDGTLALVRDATETALPLPPKSQGELSSASFANGRWRITMRQGLDTSIWSGAGDPLRIRNADVLSAGSTDDGLLTIGLSDRTVRIIDVSRAPREIASTTTGQWPECIASGTADVLWFEENHVRRWKVSEDAPRNLVDANRLLSSDVYRRIRHAAVARGGDLLIAGDSIVCRGRIETAGAAAARSTEEVMVNRGGAVIAIQKRDNDLWLVDCASAKELQLVAGATVRHFHALDDQGRVATVSASGGGSIVGLANHESRTIETPLGANSLVAADATFWLADRFGAIHRLSGQSMQRELMLGSRRMKGARLWKCGSWLVWQGVNAEMSESNPSADVQDTLLFFEIMGKPALREVGLRSFPIECGRLVCVTPGPRQQIIALFRGHSLGPLIAAVGTPAAFIDHTEQTMSVDFAGLIHDCVFDAERDLLFIHSDHNDLVVVDAGTMKTRARLSSSRPFTAIAGDGGGNLVVVEGNEQLYRCRLEVPDAHHLGDSETE